MKYDGGVSLHIKGFEASNALAILTNPEIVLDILQMIYHIQLNHG